MPEWGLESWSPSEEGERQLGLLLANEPQKEDGGKCGHAAEWGRGAGDKGHGTG